MFSPLEDFEAALPHLIARTQIGHYTGGLIAPRTMANLDSQGKGPKRRIRYGSKVAYPREAFIDWLKERLEVENA